VIAEHPVRTSDRGKRTSAVRGHQRNERNQTSRKNRVLAGCFLAGRYAINVGVKEK
jgi:hypothetical protein